jgi:hypothetical protein
MGRWQMYLAIASVVNGVHAVYGELLEGVDGRLQLF